jgi:hypothetical protein
MTGCDSIKGRSNKGTASIVVFAYSVLSFTHMGDIRLIGT